MSLTNFLTYVPSVSGVLGRFGLGIGSSEAENLLPSGKIELTGDDVVMAKAIIGDDFFREGAVRRKDSDGNSISASQVEIASHENAPIIKCSANVVRWMKGKLGIPPRGSLPLKPEVVDRVRNIALALCTAYKSKRAMEEMAVGEEPDPMVEGLNEMIAEYMEELESIVKKYWFSRSQTAPASLTPKRM
tara:strand:- start:76 stop:642 length:567 start_codon:yes stop_codon:yes gene_type:complete